jgi:hypothetical protein
MSGPAVAPALLSALRERADAIPAEQVDRVWFFASRPVGDAESALAVLSLLDPADPERRRVILTLHCTSSAERRAAPPVIELREQGSAPADRVEGVVQGVLRRLRDATEVPHVVEIRASPDRWAAVLGDHVGTG